MDPDRIRSVFEQAAGAPPADRAAILERVCGDDASLREEVARLLQFAVEEADTALGDDDPLIGAGIGQWCIHRELGSGASGQVYEATSCNGDRCAIKLLRSHRSSEESRRRFLQEAKILRGLSHPGISQILDAGIEDISGCQRQWIAMQLVAGARTLWSWVLEHDPGRDARLRVFSEICHAVGAAHAAGVIHRDLKPDNILIDREDRPHIIDFGIAHAAEGPLHHESLETRQGQLLGTLQFVAPELTEGAGAPTAQSDVYALGLMLYELLSGQPPYVVHPTNIAAAIDTIRRADPAPLSTLDHTLQGDLDTITSKAMSHDPTHRYATASDMAHDLDRVIRGDRITARPEPRLHRYIRRHRHAATVLLFAAPTFLALAIIATVFAWDSTNSRNALIAEADRRNRLLAYAESMLSIQDEMVRPHTMYWSTAIEQHVERARRLSGDDGVLFAHMLLLAGGPEQWQVDRRSMLDEAAAAVSDLPRADPTRIAVQLRRLLATNPVHDAAQQLRSLANDARDSPPDLRADVLAGAATAHLNSPIGGRLISDGHEWSAQAESVINDELNGDPDRLTSLLHRRAWAWLFRGGEPADLIACEDVLRSRLIPLTVDHFGSRSLQSIGARGLLGLCLLQQGNTQGAVEALRSVVEDATANIGVSHNITWRHMNNLGLALCAAAESEHDPAEQRAMRAEAQQAWTELLRAATAFGVRGEVDWYGRSWATTMPDHAPPIDDLLAAWDDLHAGQEPAAAP